MKFLFIIQIILGFIIQRSFQRNHVGTISGYQVGCYNLLDCDASNCRQGCVDCDGDQGQFCQTCEYGYFLFHTPDNTIECLPCPGYNPTSVDDQAKHICASCIEMPLIWEFDRTCKFMYKFEKFLDADIPTPLNTTLNKPDIYAIKVDSNVEQNLIDTRYFTEKMLDNCESYTWKNYAYDTQFKDVDIQGNFFDEFNDQECEVCLEGFIFQNDVCSSCSASVSLCSACYLYEGEVACSVCNTGYAPDSTFQNCISCSETSEGGIQNCSECYYNSNQAKIVCSTCASGYRVDASDSTVCNVVTCEDPNCVSCPEYDDQCETCKARYTVEDDVCVIAQECQDIYDPDSCKLCYDTVNLSLDDDFKCRYCGLDKDGGYECKQICDTNFGFDEDSGSCISCNDIDVNCQSCFFESGGDSFCYACQNGYGLNDQGTCTQNCQEIIAGCNDCVDYGDGDGYECLSCDTSAGYGPVYNTEWDLIACKLCSEGDSKCSSCEYVMPDEEVRYIIQCKSCSDTLYEPDNLAYVDGSGNPVIYQDKDSEDIVQEVCTKKDCLDLFDNCVNEKCQSNSSYGKYSDDVVVYPTQKNICNVCSPGYSLTSNGSACEKNINQCKNSILLSDSVATKLNPYYQSEDSENGYCYNGCRKEDGSPLGADEYFFYDPYLQKCIQCDEKEMCRYKVVINKYITFSNTSPYDAPPTGIEASDWLYYNDLFTDEANAGFWSLDFDFENLAEDFKDWEKMGVSEFQFNINFVTLSQGKNNFSKDNTAPELNLSAKITSNISQYIFRVKQIAVNFQTWQYSATQDDQLINFNEQKANIYADSFDIEINGITEFSITNLQFYGGSRLSAEDKNDLRDEDDYETLFISFELTMNDNLPMSKLSLTNTQFLHQINTYLVPKFTMLDLGTLEIQKMSYSAKQTDQKALTGFQMFTFIKYRVQIQPFNLIVKQFKLEDMYLENSIVFEIPQKNANIQFENINLENLVFKNSMFLGDTSSGLGKGEQWIRFDDITLSNSQFYDSSLIYVANAKYFLAIKWSIDTVHLALADNDSQALIQTNTFIIDNVEISNIMCYGTSILKHIESPSVVDYYSSSNIFKSVSLLIAQVYLKQSENLFSMQGFMNLELSGFSFYNIKVAEGLKLNSDVVSYYHDEDFEVKAISRYNVIAMTDTSVPDWLIQIYSKTVTSSATITGFEAFGMGNINLLEIVNMDEVIIAEFNCGSTDPSQIYKANCFKAHTTGTSNLKKCSIEEGLISNIFSEEGTPLIVLGFKNIQLKVLHVQGVTSKSGFHLQPWGDEGEILIDDCYFTNISTILDKQVEITGAALYLDGSVATQNDFTISNSIFESIYTRYQGAGVYAYSPINQCDLTLQSVNMTNVFGIQGGYLHAKLSGTSQSNVNLNDILFQGPSNNETYTYGLRLLKVPELELGGDEEEEQEIDYYSFRTSEILSNLTLNGFKNYFEQVNTYENDDDEEDSILTAANLYPSAIYLDSSTISIENMIISGISEQQGLRIENSIITIINLNQTDVICIECSQYMGSSIIKNSLFDISDSLFQDSQAYIGGGLYIADKGVCDSHCPIYNTTFKNNWAYTLGGGLYIKDTFYNITDCVFEGNTAQGKYSGSTTLRGQGGALYTEISSTIDISSLSSSRRQLASDNTLQIISGTNFKDNLAEVGGAGRTMGGYNTTISGSSYIDNKGSQYHDDIVQYCVYGEGKSSDGNCQTCPSGQYSLDPYGETCMECQTGTICQGGDRVYNNASYWRDNNLTDEFWRCSNAPSNCLIGKDYTEDNYNAFTCNEGYIGARCEACDLRGKYTTNGEKYSVSSSYSCGKCSDQQTNALKVFAMNVWVLFSMFLAVKGTLVLVQEKIMLRSILTLFKGFRARYDETGILIKMFTNYAQIIVIVSTLDIDLPNGLTDAQDVVGNPVKSMGNALDCYLVEIQDKIPNIYFKIIWQLVMNLAQFLLFVLFFAIAKALKKTRISFHHLFWTTVIYLMIYLQPSYVNAILETVSCLKLGSYSYILADVQYYCYTDEYKLWSYVFLFPFLSFWVIFLPGLMFYILYRHKKRQTLQDAETLYNYGFLYQEYRQEVYYWELVKVFQKTLIVAVIQLYSNDIKEKAILVFEIVFIYAILAYYRRPYSSKQLNELDILSSIVCCLSLITGVFIYKINYSYWKWIGLVTIFMINMCFVLLMIYKILEKFRVDFFSKNSHHIEKAKKKIPALSKIFKLSPEIIDKRRSHWKLLRNHVNLFIDGRKCRIIKMSIEKQDLISSQIRDSSHLLPDLNALEKQQSVEVIDLNLGSQIKKQHLDNQYPTIKSQEQKDPGLSLKRHLSKGKTFLLPDFEKQQSNMFISKQDSQFTSIQVLNCTLTKAEKELLETTVNQFRKIQFQEEEEMKEKFKQYLINELHIQPYIPKQQEQEVQVKDSDKKQNIAKIIPQSDQEIKSQGLCENEDDQILKSDQINDKQNNNKNNNDIQIHNPEEDEEIDSKIIKESSFDEQNSVNKKHGINFQIKEEDGDQSDIQSQRSQVNLKQDHSQGENTPNKHKRHRSKQKVEQSKFNISEHSPQHSQQ